MALVSEVKVPKRGRIDVLKTEVDTIGLERAAVDERHEDPLDESGRIALHDFTRQKATELFAVQNARDARLDDQSGPLGIPESTESVRPATNFGVQTTPAVKETRVFRLQVGLLVKTTFCSDSVRPGSPIGTGGPPSEVGQGIVDSVSALKSGCHKVRSATARGSLCQWWHGLVSDSSIGCQRMPNFGTATFVLLFSNCS